jgi:predicted DCC family thiol-disulfide oxidoreductase YuxK
MDNKYKIMKVYFNNSCKICRSEINLYKKENIKEIDWVDITNNSAAEKETSKKDKELLRRLHVKDRGKIIGGAEAFLYVWKKIPKYKFLYNFFKLPIIFTFFKFGYEIIAYFLYLKNKKQLKN